MGLTFLFDHKPGTGLRVDRHIDPDLLILIQGVLPGDTLHTLEGSRGLETGVIERDRDRPGDGGLQRIEKHDETLLFERWTYMNVSVPVPAISPAQMDHVSIQDIAVLLVPGNG